jgi:DNA-binding MarR family transcriptional regulator
LNQRTLGPGDARSLLVELTPHGRKRAEAAFREYMAAERSMLSGLPENEIAKLEMLLC